MQFCRVYMMLVATSGLILMAMAQESFCTTTFTGTDSFITPTVTEPPTIYITNGTTTTAPVTIVVTVRETTTSTETDPYLIITIADPIPTTIATIRINQTFCINNSSFPLRTAVVFTGSYTPIAGQTVLTRPTETQPTFPCTVTSTTTNTMFQPPTTVRGSVTVTSVITGGMTKTSTATSTTTAWTYLETITSYRSNWVVDKITYATTRECQPTETVTYHTRCAWYNQVSEMEGRRVDWLGDRDKHLWVAWPEPSDFEHYILTGAQQCCQICVESEHCVLSSHRVPRWDCSWYFLGPGGTCPLDFVLGFNNARDGFATRSFQVTENDSNCGQLKLDPSLEGPHK
ncbi:hypothetical protein V8F20_011898 [Naviculisporaceae sp. PSN 640]